MSKKSDPAELNFEQAFEELQVVINELEAGEKPLEQSLTMFERGQALYQRCTDLLDKAELKVQQISDSGELNNFTE
ncbi:MAG: exodeoxyribonuclease VII small subunit [Chloroflexota bacterium]